MRTVYVRRQRGALTGLIGGESGRRYNSLELEGTEREETNMIIQILMLLGLAAPKADTALAQSQTCVWPNVCTVETVETAQVQPCVWPNLCREEEAFENKRCRATSLSRAG